MKKLFVFDLDGTLVDSLKDITSALNFALSVYDVPQITEQQCRGMIGNGPSVLVQRATPDCYDAARNRILHLYHMRYNQHAIDQTAVFPGMTEILKALHAHGARLAVLSNKSNEHATKIVRALFPDNLFWQIVGQSDAFEAKPNPASLLHLVMTANLDPKDTAYIGDSPVDVQTAANAGIDCVCVGWGYSTWQTLLDSGSGEIANDPARLFEMLQAL